MEAVLITIVIMLILGVVFGIYMYIKGKSQGKHEEKIDQQLQTIEENNEALKKQNEVIDETVKSNDDFLDNNSRDKYKTI